MKLCHLLVAGLVLSFLLVTALSVVYADSNVLIASYTNGSDTNTDWLDRLHPSSDTGGSAVSESFQSSSSLLRITKASFQLCKQGSPSGMAHAKLYEMGSDDSPNGSALATSDDFDVSVITVSYVWYNLTFSGLQKYTMQLSHSYCIVFEDPTSGSMNFMNFIYLRGNYSSGGYSGVGKGFHDNAWYLAQPISGGGSDFLFMVYGEVPTVPSPSNTQAWIGIAAPHVYAAITIWSLAMIIGVGAALSKGFNVADLPYLVLMGLAILICLFVALAIMSGFVNL